jgi:hypothetical protein
MLVHTVLFQVADHERPALLEGIAALRAVPSVRHLWAGMPAPVAARPSLLTDYSVALTIIFDDLAGHDLYQAHPLHQAFLAAHKHRWTGVRVIDHGA